MSSTKLVCVETGESWNSVKSCAQARGISYSYMRKQIQKGLPIRSLHYRRVKRLLPKNHVRVRCVETGEEFASTHEACRAFGHHEGYVAQVIKACSDWDVTFAGYHWERVE